MPYGMTVYASNGSTKLIEVTSRTTVAVQRGTTASITSGSSLDTNITGMDTSGNWQVFIYPLSAPSSANSDNFSQSVNTGFFRITNSMGVTSAFDYFVVKSG